MSWQADRSEVVPGTTSNQVTELLRRWREGDQEALDSLVSLVYDELLRGRAQPFATGAPRSHRPGIHKSTWANGPVEIQTEKAAFAGGLVIL